ncbi:hypothetical protein EHH54_10395 [Rhizobium leguminosarum]|uniref:hypothetical protein n=1 Tax=Rhizobium leguminosarum TaxID=384 RepID=UPI000FEC4DCE|nr:hypothetical protein [Rhizobium leguminosarum]RWX40810.1 hypothetical protein EHH54_10395 [Rhizobium leguminosarum]
MTDYTAEAKKIKEKCHHVSGAFAAGGAVTSVFTGKEINDVDVYFKSREAFEYAVASAYEDSWWCVSSSKRAVTFVDGDSVIQFMHFDFFPTAQDIFNAFDFTVVMGALDFDADEFVFHDDFLKHNSQRFLRFHPGTRYPLASAVRVLKYQDRGYTIGKGDILKIALAGRKVKIDTWEELKDQIGGAYGEKVVLEGEGQEFSLDAAIAALTVDEAGKEQFIANDNEEQPGNALDLQRKLAAMKGEEFDAGRYDGGEDGEGYPVDYEPPARSKPSPFSLLGLAA